MIIEFKVYVIIISLTLHLQTFMTYFFYELLIANLNIGKFQNVSYTHNKGKGVNNPFKIEDEVCFNWTNRFW